MARHITEVDDRPVKVVLCSPTVTDLPDHSVRRVQCRVDFNDGTSYRPEATIETVSNGDRGGSVPYRFRWDAPPLVDPTKAATTRPSGAAAETPASGTSSFLQAGNLDAVVAKLRGRFGAKGSVVQMTIFPGQVITVLADAGHASVATAGPRNAFSVGPMQPFDGSREAIYVSQISGAVVGKLVGQLATGYGGAVRRIDRVVLVAGSTSASWDIYVGAGSKRYRASITGNGLHRVGGD